MKVIILAGGWGSRLGQLTEVVPKPMVHIGNMPVLWHIMNIYFIMVLMNSSLLWVLRVKLLKLFY